MGGQFDKTGFTLVDNSKRAVVRTWNDVEMSWGPMTVFDAIRFAAEGGGMGHRYVEVAGYTIFDTDEVVFDAFKALDLDRQAKEQS